MNDQFAQIRDHFLAALECDGLEAQLRYAHEHCADSPELYAELEEMLRAHHESGNFLASRAETTEYLPRIAERPGTMIGPYKLVEEIGEGGMGSVFMALQKEPVRRKVALKVIRAGMDSKQVVSRFEAERQALAMMDHPCIAKVFDGGSTESGRPYFVMELINGMPVTDYCDRYRFTTDQRLELFGQVCQAVQHAHQKGVIHRDLKPSNILVTHVDGRAVPKVIDFGIAKATSGQLTDRTTLTHFAQMIGSPLYMSPEQAELSSLDIDTRSDVYSLGVLFYELLTGTTPFDNDTLKNAGFDELRRIIREEEPPKPSDRLSTIGAALSTISERRSVDPRKLTQTLRGELDWIVMRALEKDRSRRYESASAFADDIGRYLNDEPVEACPPSASYKFRKFARRNKAALTTIVLVLAAVAVGAGLLWQERSRTLAAFAGEKQQHRIAQQKETEARRQAQAAELARAAETEARKEAESEAAKAKAVVDLLQEMLGSASPDQTKGADYTVRELLDHFSADLGDQLKNQPEVEAELRSTIGMVYRRLSLWDKAEPHLSAALELRRRIYGNEHEKVAQSLVDYAWNQGQRTGPVKGLALAREGLAIYRKTGGQPEGMIHALRVVQHLILHGQGNYAEADAIGREALAIAQEVNKMDAPEVASILHDLAHSKTLQGDHSEAVRLAREAVALHRRVQGNEHPETAYALTTLGRALQAQGEDTAAEAPYREALAIFRKQFGDDHAKVAKLLGQLGAVLRVQGKLDQAEVQYRQAFEIHQQLASDSPADGNSASMRTARDDLIAVLKALGRNEEVEKIYRAALSQTPRTWRDFADRAHAYVGTGQHELALADLDEAIRLSPEPQWLLHRERGDVYKALGRYEEALADYDQAIRLSPKPQSFLYKVRGDVYKALDHYEEALADFDRSLELNPTQWYVYKRRSLAHFKLGHYDEALADFDEAIRLSPKPQADLQWRRGDVYKTLGRHEEALADYDRSIEADSTQYHVYKLRGLAHFKLGHYDEALADIAMAVELNPDDSSNLRWIPPTLVAECPDEELKKGILALADKTVELTGGSASAYHNSGYVKLLFGKPGEAVGDFSKAIELEPTDISHWFRRSEAYRALGEEELANADFDEYVKCLEKAIEDAPDEAVGWGNRGSAYAYLGRWSEAAADYEKAIELDPKGGSSLNSLAWFLATCPEEEFRDANRAVELATKAVELAPEDGNIWNTLGVAQYRAEDWSAVIEALEKSIELGSGGNSFDFFFLAMAHWQLGETGVRGQEPGSRDREAQAEEQPADQEPAQAEVRRWYEKAVEWMDKNKPDDEELIRFRQEAEDLLNVADTDKKPEPKTEDVLETDEPNTEPRQPSTDPEEATDDE